MEWNPARTIRNHEPQTQPESNPKSAEITLHSLFLERSRGIVGAPGPCEEGTPVFAEPASCGRPFAPQRSLRHFAQYCFSQCRGSGWGLGELASWRGRLTHFRCSAVASSMAGDGRTFPTCLLGKWGICVCSSVYSVGTSSIRVGSLPERSQFASPTVVAARFRGT